MRFYVQPKFPKRDLNPQPASIMYTILIPALPNQFEEQELSMPLQKYS
jgi:hypothetical protein